MIARLHQNDGRLTGWCNRCGGPCYNYVHPHAAHRCPPKRAPEEVLLIQTAHHFIDCARAVATSSAGSLFNLQCRKNLEDAQAQLEGAVEAHARLCGKPA